MLPRRHGLLGGQQIGLGVREGGVARLGPQIPTRAQHQVLHGNVGQVRRQRVVTILGRLKVPLSPGLKVHY